MINALSIASKAPMIQIMIWYVSIFAILTSMIGVGIGLFDFLKTSIKINNNNIQKIISSFLTIIPAYTIAIIVPNAFLSILGFAAIILSIIAIILPIYLFYKAKIKKLHYTELKYRSLIYISLLSGIFICICELINIFL